MSTVQRPWLTAGVVVLLALLAGGALLGCTKSGSQGGPAPRVATASPTTDSTGPATPRPTRSLEPTRSPTPPPTNPTPEPVLPAPGTTFTGTTSQGTSVVLTIGPGPSLVDPTKIVVDWECSDGSRSGTSYSLGTGVGEQLAGPGFELFTYFGEGWSGTFTSPTTAEGRGRFVQDLPLAAGAVTCDTGAFTWSATGTWAGPVPSPTIIGPLEPMTLQTAIAGGFVDVDVHGMGASTGDAIVMTVSSNADQELEIDLPEGTALRASTGGVQDMVVRQLKGELDSPFAETYTPTDAIRLDPFEVLSYLVEAYCLDFHADNPQPTTGFRVQGPARKVVVRVLRAADELTPKPSIVAIQSAIWAVTDDVGRGELRARFPVTRADLRRAEAIVKAAGLRAADYRLFR